MSWIEQITNIELKIQTGDGSEFTPLWKNSTRNRDMNASVFDFNNTEGSLVRRGKTPGMRYPFEFHFVGEDNLEETARFDEAAKDQRPWILTHPVYGQVLVQPISIKYDDSSQNVTIVTGKLYETIEDTSPTVLLSIEALILAGADDTADAIAEGYAEDFEPEITGLLATILKIAEIFSKIASVADDIKELQQKLNDVLNAIDQILLGPEAFMRAVTELARAPGEFVASVKDRIDGIKETFDEMKLAIGGLSSLIGIGNTGTKKYIESLNGSMVLSMAETAVKLTSDNISNRGLTGQITIEDYQTRTEVLNVIEILKSTYDEYINDLGIIQTEVDATPDSYTPKQANVNALKDLINKTTGQLLQIAVGAKQERKYTVPSDTNLIMLVHRLLNTTDHSEIQAFAEANGILLEEWIQIPKGREVLYYL